MSIWVHPTANVSPRAIISDGVSIWDQAQIREGAILGKNCIIGKGVYIDTGVSIGDNTKIQNYVSLFHGVVIEDGVFIGPHVCTTNDLRPRAINPDGSLKLVGDWVITDTLICRGAAVGANSTIVCGVRIGIWAMIGSGSVITCDIPDYGLAWGNPTRLYGFVCPCGMRLEKKSQEKVVVITKCPQCGQMVDIPHCDWEKII